MLNREITFNAGALITPDLAARIAQAASKYTARVYLSYRSIELCVDSLIGILAMNIHQGSKVVVSAEGEQAAEALQAICDIMEN